MRLVRFLLATVGLCAAIVPAHAEETSNRYNVLFIAVDDLRPELGCYGAEYMITPKIDALAATGRQFNHHYVQVPTCGASRYALLTGRRTSESGASGNGAFFGGRSALSRTPLDGAQTMPELFRRSGYKTTLIGKISHQPDGKVYAYNGSGDGRIELPGAWDELATPYGRWKRGWGIFFAYADGRHREDRSGYRPVYEMPDCDDMGLPDGLMAAAACEALERMTDERFFLALGFFKPHLPFVAPKKYWDMYESVDIPAPANPERTSAYGHSSGECFGYQFPFPKDRPLPEDRAKELKRAYASCVSYTDAQVGKVLAKLDELGLADKTIVVLWGDHGWHLGENMVWGKHTPLERSLNSPLIVRVPGMPFPGQATDALTETLDIYPTLIDICNTRKKGLAHSLAGKSFTAALDDPSNRGKTSAIGYWSARTVRTDRYRLIAKMKDGRFTGVELYDHTADPLETVNVAEEKPKVVEELLQRLKRDSPVMR